MKEVRKYFSTNKIVKIIRQVKRKYKWNRPKGSLIAFLFNKIDLRVISYCKNHATHIMDTDRNLDFCIPTGQKSLYIIPLVTIL